MDLVTPSYKWLLVLLIFLFAFSSLEAEGQTENFWVKKASFSGLKREKAVGFGILDHGYAFGGVDTADIVHNDLWQYSPASNSWTQKATLPASVRRSAVAFSINNKGYIATGADSADASSGNKLFDTWEYDPAVNNWTQKADYPGAGGNGVYHATGFAIDSLGYICGGKIGPSNYMFDLWSYSPVTDSWTQRSDFPGGVRYKLTSFSAGGIGYVGLGIDYDVYREDIWAYDPGTDTWTQAADFGGGARASTTTFTINAVGYIGFGEDGGFRKDLWAYNAATDSWSPRANCPGEERRYAIGFTINGRGYAGIGQGLNGLKTSFYEYTPLLVTEVQENLVGTIRVYPNPVVGWLTLEELSAEIAHIEIMDATGKILLYQAAYTNTVKLNCNQLSSGQYWLVFKDNTERWLGAKSVMVQ